MIELSHLTFTAPNGRLVFDTVSLTVPSDRRIALLGAMASGKTSLIQLLAGLATPTSGRIVRHARLSFPGGYQRGFRTAHSAAQNLAFAATIYGADSREVVDFVGTVTGLGAVLHRPMRELAVQDRINLSHALTYAIPFDTYLFDNSIGGTGDAAFRQTCLAMYRERTRTAGAIVATRHPRIARELCDCAVLIGSDGSLAFVDDLEDALARFGAQQAVSGRSPTPSFGDPAPAASRADPVSLR